MADAGMIVRTKFHELDDEGDDGKAPKVLVLAQSFDFVDAMEVCTDVSHSHIITCADSPLRGATPSPRHRTTYSALEYVRLMYVFMSFVDVRLSGLCHCHRAVPDLAASAAREGTVPAVCTAGAQHRHRDRSAHDVAGVQGSHCRSALHPVRGGVCTDAGPHRLLAVPRVCSFEDVRWHLTLHRLHNTELGFWDSFKPFYTVTSATSAAAEASKEAGADKDANQ